MKVISGLQYYASKTARVSAQQSTDGIDETVLEIIKEVRTNGDKALLAYTEKFDGVKLDELIVTKEEFEEAKSLVSQEFVDALRQAYIRIESFHKNQVEKSWFTNDEKGILLGQKVTPLASIGVYVPGGKAAYPSSVLMNVIPAKIAGVHQIAMTTPPGEDGKVNPYVLVAAAESGVDLVYKAGGAQAIAALAYGTESIQKVVKIVGPGNAYVACAKKWVFGEVDIDMIAGPSEICVVADDTAVPSYVAADLLSQAEHDELASAICITTSQDFAEKLKEEVRLQAETLERKEIIDQSIEANGRIIVVDTIIEAYDVVNDLAPEHLQLMVENPLEDVQYVQNAGAIFLGNYSPEALGDYMAGPNHTLPTSGTATFSSPLGVYDFIKRSSIIHYSEQALQAVANDVMIIANAEGLTGHAKSIEIRKGE